MKQYFFCFQFTTNQEIVYSVLFIKDFVTDEYDFIAKKIKGTASHCNCKILKPEYIYC